nr:unnamed protein product [Callosobruchus analis]
MSIFPSLPNLGMNI